jgi:hypothetical protein
MPINQVAKELGVCATILKKICRKNGIPRWPHRKIKSLDKMIANLEMNLTKNPNEKEEINHEVELLKTKKQEIMNNPDILVSQSMSRIAGKHALGLSPNPMKKTNQVRAIGASTASIVSRLGNEDSLEEQQDNFFREGQTVSNWKERIDDRFPINTLSDLHIQNLRRASLPNFGVKFPIPGSDSLTTPNTINLPPPIRRHSMDSFLSTKSLSPSIPQHSAPTIMDLSQKLPEFEFPSTSPTPSSPLPCIEPLVGRSNSLLPQPKNSFPDWFLAEKNRVLGRD